MILDSIPPPLPHFDSTDLLCHWKLSSVFLTAMIRCSVMSDSFTTSWTAVLQIPLSLGILQARILEQVAMPSSRVSSQPRDRTQVSCIADGFFTLWAIRETMISCSFSVGFICHEYIWFLIWMRRLMHSFIQHIVIKCLLCAWALAIRDRISFYVDKNYIILLLVEFMF